MGIESGRCGIGDMPSTGSSVPVICHAMKCITMITSYECSSIHHRGKVFNTSGKYLQKHGICPTFNQNSHHTHFEGGTLVADMHEFTAGIYAKIRRKPIPGQMELSAKQILDGNKVHRFAPKAFN